MATNPAANPVNPTGRVAPQPGVQVQPPPPGGAVPAAMPRAPSVQEASAVFSSIANRTFLPNAARVNALNGAPLQAAEFARLLPDEVKGQALNAKQEMIGVGATDVLTAFYETLTLARHTGHYTAFIQDCVIAVNMGPTVARNRINQYAALSELSMFKRFEINGRVADLLTQEGRDGSWIAGSRMHAGAIRLLGLILLSQAPAGGFLERVRNRMGSLMALPAPPPQGVDEPERTKIMREAAAGLSPAERALITGLPASVPRLFTMLDQIYGESGGNIDLAIAAAAALNGAEI